MPKSRLPLRLSRPLRESVFQKWVVRATRPPRSATRRPELWRVRLQKGRPDWVERLLPFRPASRRTAQAGRLCHPKAIFQTRSELRHCSVFVNVRFPELLGAPDRRDRTALYYIKG